eukprot:PhF_6_TR10015/c0_g1_i2/m.15319
MQTYVLVSYVVIPVILMDLTTISATQPFESICSYSDSTIGEHDYNNNVTTITIEEPYTFDSTCVVSHPRVVIECSSNATTLYCPRDTGNPSCFLCGNKTLSFSILGCVVEGAAVSFMSSLGNLTIQSSLLRGLNAFQQINVAAASTVRLLDTLVEHGYDRSIWLGGGCLSLRGIKNGIYMSNMTIQNCMSNRNGGCVNVLGTGKELVADWDPLPYDEYGGDFVMTSSRIENCTGKGSPGGGVSIRYVASLRMSDSVIQNCWAKTTEGCIEIIYVGPGVVELTRLTVYNCTALQGSNGCVALSPRDHQVEPLPAPMILSDVRLSRCRAAGSGGLTVSSSFRDLILRNVVVHDSMVNSSCGCLLLYNLMNVVLRNITLQQCVTDHAGGMAITDVKNISVFGLTIRDTIVKGHSAAVESSNVGTLTMSNTIFNNIVSRSSASCLYMDNTHLVMTNFTLWCTRGVTTRRYKVNGNTFTAPQGVGVVTTENALDILTSTMTVPPKLTRAPLKAIVHVSASSNYYSGLQATGVIIQSGSMAIRDSESPGITTSWLTGLLDECNVYSSSFLERWIAPDFEGPPREMNLYILLGFLTAVSVLEMLCTFLWIKIRPTTYDVTPHPTGSLRVFVVVVSDLTASSVFCIVSATSPQQIVLGVMGLLTVCGWTIGTAVWTYQARTRYPSCYRQSGKVIPRTHTCLKYPRW